MKVQMIKVKDVVADENQPRKFFDAAEMRSLKESIKKYGIKVPINVEDMGNGKFLLEDGERRYRTALDLGLKEIPATIDKLKSSTERLVSQFNIQEQHAAWTPVEKAVAISRLSSELGVSLVQVCKLLNVTNNEATRYAAFAELVDKESFIRNEIPLDYALPLRSLGNAVKVIMEDKLEKEFSRNDNKKLENRVIFMLKNGSIVKRADLNRIKDALTKEPKLIDKFLTNDKVTPSSLFLEAKAKGAYHLRNALASARYLAIHGDDFLKLRDVELQPHNIQEFKRAAEVLKKLIAIGD